MFTDLTDRLADASTENAFMKTYIELVNFTKVNKKLMSFVNWWHARRRHVFKAFKDENAPTTNLQETLHSSWKHTNMNYLSLTKAASMDCVEAGLAEAEFLQYKSGLYRGT